MTNELPEVAALTKRLTKLEKENRVLKQFGLVALLLAAVFVAMGPGTGHAGRLKRTHSSKGRSRKDTCRDRYGCFSHAVFGILWRKTETRQRRIP